jgi:integrase
VKAELVAEPAKSERTGKRLWGEVDGLHTVHDARHTYCYVRMLGDDGEPRQDIKFCSAQLGHADEQMVMRIYNKTNLAQRLRLLELKEARKGRAA